MATKIHKKVVEIMTKEAGAMQLRGPVKNLIPESIGKETGRQTQGIIPLKGVLIVKVTVIKKPKFDITKHGAPRRFSRVSCSTRTR